MTSGFYYDESSDVWKAFFQNVEVDEERKIRTCDERTYTTLLWRQGLLEKTFWQSYDPSGRIRGSEVALMVFLMQCDRDPTCKLARQKIDEVTTPCFEIETVRRKVPFRAYRIPCHPWATLEWDGIAWTAVEGQEGYTELYGGDGFATGDAKEVEDAEALLITVGEKADSIFDYEPSIGSAYFLDERLGRIQIVRPEQDEEDRPFALALPSNYRVRGIRALHLCQAHFTDAGVARLLVEWNATDATNNSREHQPRSYR